MTASRVALVTGVGRPEGLGIEVARQLATAGLRVWVSARDRSKAAGASAILVREGLDVRGVPLDVGDDASVARAAAWIGEHGALDVLVNNAGGYFDLDRRTIEVDLAFVREALETNLLGAWRTSIAMLPLLRRSSAARIVNVSSEAGSFGGGHGLGARGDTLAAYGVSKAALDAFTVKLATALAPERIKVNAVCPGFVATYPGTAEMGARPVTEGAKGIVWAATLPDDGPTGGFFRDGKPIAW